VSKGPAQAATPRTHVWPPGRQRTLSPPVRRDAGPVRAALRHATGYRLAGDARALCGEREDPAYRPGPSYRSTAAPRAYRSDLGPGRHHARRLADCACRLSAAGQSARWDGQTLPDAVIDPDRACPDRRRLPVPRCPRHWYRCGKAG
jgi:hypothetical protein